MSKLTEDFDLFAIIVLAFVLGVAQAPKWDVKTMGVELKGRNFRILHVDPMVRTISIFR